MVASRVRAKVTIARTNHPYWRCILPSPHCGRWPDPTIGRAATIHSLVAHPSLSATASGWPEQAAAAMGVAGQEALHPGAGLGLDGSRRERRDAFRPVATA